VIAWRQVPWTLWAFAVLGLAGLIVVVVRTVGDTPAIPLGLYVVLTFAWLYFLLKGVKWVWMITVGVSLVGTLFDLIAGSWTWLTLISGLVSLLLLVLPITCRYVGVRTIFARP
jgi:hypothetical protein